MNPRHHESSSSSSSPLLRIPVTNRIPSKPHISFAPLQASPSKSHQNAKLKSKRTRLGILKLDSEMSGFLSRKQLHRNVLKYVSKLEVQNSCQRLPNQLGPLIPNCKHLIIHPNSNLTKKGIAPFAKSIHRASPKFLTSLHISTVHSSINLVDFKLLFNAIMSKRNLNTLKLTLNPYFTQENIYTLRRVITSLYKMESLTLIALHLPREPQETLNPLRAVLHNVKHLKHFSMKCPVARSSCEEFNHLIEKVTQSNRLTKIELFIATSDRFPATFFSHLSEKICVIPDLNVLGITIDSFIKQTFNSSFFLALGRMTKLEKLLISADQLNIGDHEMQALFKSLVRLTKLKELKMHSNVRAINFSDEYYGSFHKALQHLTQLEDFTYELRNLGSGYFPCLFSELPMFSKLRNLSLNVTISEGDLNNVHFLSEFLKHSPNLKSLTLKINDFASDNYTYLVPSEVFNILEEGLKATPALERFELRLGSIEDGGLNRILLTLNELTALRCLKLDAFFHEITYHAFGDLCQKLQEQKRRLHEIQIAPKCYPYSNFELLGKVIQEIQRER